MGDTTVEIAEKQSKKDEVFFTRRDLTSDYFQVLIQKGRPRWCKAIWLVLILVFLGFTSYMVYKLLTSYLEYKSFNSQSEKWENSVILPAMTICNLNFINYTDWISTIDDTGVEEELLWFLTEIKQHTGLQTVEDSEELDMERAKTLDTIMDDGAQVNLLSEFRFAAKQYLIGNGVSYPEYQFGGVWRNISDDTIVKGTATSNIGETELGECILLNDDQSLVQRVGTVNGGFTIDLDTRVKQYLPSVGTKGFKLFLRNPNETVLLDKGGILVSPGKEVFINLHKREIKRLKPRYGTCENVESMFNRAVMRTVRECIQEVALEVQIQQCNCLPWYLVEKIHKLLQLDNTTSYTWDYWLGYIDQELKMTDFRVATCGFSVQSICDIMVMEQLKQNAKDAKADKVRTCAEPCNYLEWHYTLTQSNFPASEEYFNYFMKDTMEGNNTFEYAQENLIRLHVYYGDLKKIVIAQEKAYEIHNFVAEFGGTVDLLIGLSAFIVFQFIEVILAFVIYKCCRTKRTGTADDPD